MAFRKVARFHLRHEPRAGAPDWSPIWTLAGLRILDLLAISVIILLAVAPFVWRNLRADKYMEQWSAARFAEMGAVEADWMAVPKVPVFLRGDEPEVRAFLRAQPLVLAVQARGGREVWIRRGELLVPAADSPLAPVIRPWFDHTAQAQTFFWNPMDALPGELRPGPKIVLMGNQWVVAKWWREGSAEVEASLQNVIGSSRNLRVMLLRDGEEDRKDLKALPWGAMPHLQVDVGHYQKDKLFRVGTTSNEFPGWNLWMIPFPAEARAMRRTMVTQFTLMAAGSCLVGVSLLLAMYLRTRARRKVALDADLMASMTHSLKTPLAILKSRCDTLRLGRISADQVDAQLIRIGGDADRLSEIIENVLTAIQGASASSPQEEVTPDWIQGVADDLIPAFEAASRKLTLACVEQSGRASLPSLRAALLTLMENALHHGEGAVSLETLRVRKRLLIRVCDHGPGLGPVDLKALGRPFLKIREQGQEGFKRDGHGLGLSLLAKVAEREGWGLSFGSEPGKGLCATVEIQAM